MVSGRLEKVKLCELYKNFNNLNHEIFSIFVYHGLLSHYLLY